MFSVEFFLNTDGAKRKVSELKKLATDMFVGANKEADKMQEKVKKTSSAIVQLTSQEERLRRKMNNPGTKYYTGGTRDRVTGFLGTGANDTPIMGKVPTYNFGNPSYGGNTRSTLISAIKSGAIKNPMSLRRDFYKGDRRMYMHDLNDKIEQQQRDNAAKVTPVIAKQTQEIKKNTQEIKQNTEAKKQNNRASGGGGGGNGGGGGGKPWPIGGGSGTAWGSRGSLAGGWLSRQRYQLLTMMTGGASLYGAVRVGKNIFNSAKEQEMDYMRMTVPFGNKGNVAAAMKLAENTKGPFKRADMLAGFQSMMKYGIDPRKSKNFNTIGNVAGKRGMSLADVSGDIGQAISGNSSVMRDYGFTNRQIKTLDRMKNPNNRKDAIMAILNGDKRYKNGMAEFANTWAGMTNKMSNHWDRFKKAIMGDPKDKNSLYNKIKGVFQSVLNWMEKNGERIKRAGMFIGEVMKWVVRQVHSFMAWIGRGIEGILKKTDGSVESFRDKTLKFILWLELTKEKVVRFFDKWGWAIWGIVKIWAASKIVGTMVGGVAAIIKPFRALFTLLGVGGGKGGLIGAIGMFGRAAMTALGPIGIAVASIVALLATVRSQGAKNPMDLSKGGKVNPTDNLGKRIPFMQRVPLTAKDKKDMFDGTLNLNNGLPGKKDMTNPNQEQINRLNGSQNQTKTYNVNDIKLNGAPTSSNKPVDQSLNIEQVIIEGAGIKDIESFKKALNGVNESFGNATKKYN